jgi:hypothetical protein
VSIHSVREKLAGQKAEDFSKPNPNPNPNRGF